jgi:hypothetical protein
VHHAARTKAEAFLLTTVLAGVALVAAVTASAQSQTVVSLVFDDGWDS